MSTTTALAALATVLQVVAVVALSPVVVGGMRQIRAALEGRPTFSSLPGRDRITPHASLGL